MHANIWARTCIHTRNQSIFHFTFFGHALEFFGQHFHSFNFATPKLHDSHSVGNYRSIFTQFGRKSRAGHFQPKTQFKHSTQCNPFRFHSFATHRIMVGDLFNSLMIVRRYELPLDGQMVVMMMMRMRCGRWIGGELIWTIRFVWRCSR